MEYQNWKFELESDNFTNDSKDEKYQKIIEKVEEGATSVAYKEKKNWEKVKNIQKFFILPL